MTTPDPDPCPPYRQTAQTAGRALLMAAIRLASASRTVRSTSAAAGRTAATSPERAGSPDRAARRAAVGFMGSGSLLDAGVGEVELVGGQGQGLPLDGDPEFFGVLDVQGDLPGRVLLGHHLVEHLPAV